MQTRNSRVEFTENMSFFWSKQERNGPKLLKALLLLGQANIWDNINSLFLKYFLKIY
jgi:hypothetical protein